MHISHPAIRMPSLLSNDIPVYLCCRTWAMQTSFMAAGSLRRALFDVPAPRPISNKFRDLLRLEIVFETPAIKLTIPCIRPKALQRRLAASNSLRQSVRPSLVFARGRYCKQSSAAEQRYDLPFRLAPSSSIPIFGPLAGPPTHPGSRSSNGCEAPPARSTGSPCGFVRKPRRFRHRRATCSPSHRS